MIKNNISKLRKEKNLSQEQLAKEVGVVQGAISQFEKGINYPSVLVAIKLSEILGVTVNDLYKVNNK